MNKMKAIRCLLYTAEAVGCYILQTSVGIMPEFFSEKPMLLIPAALTAGAFEDETTSVLYGALCGALADCAVFGTGCFYGTTLSAACYVISSLYRERVRTSLLTVFTIAGAASVLITALHFVIFYVMAGYPEPLTCFTGHYLPRAAYTLAFIPVFYRINSLVRKKLGMKRRYY